IEDGKWVPQTLLRAKDLPRTNLSDHIERRLFTRMNQKREETAKSWGTEMENVSEAVDLVVKSSGSCHLLNDQDYIFYYHPETQKTPKEEKLQQCTCCREVMLSGSKWLNRWLNKEQKQKVMTLNGALDALVQASRCRNIDSYPDCQTIMRLLRHASRCSVRLESDQSHVDCKQEKEGDKEDEVVIRSVKGNHDFERLKFSPLPYSGYEY
nr:histone acetyltransferase HAC12-like isoform X1 [Tanacetum cinerariifolium]